MSKKNPFKRLIERSIRSAVYSAFGIKPNKNRRIPSEIKNEVHKRDSGRCVICGSNVNLEFDHDIPFSKGGSNTVDNVQLLCKRCNRRKSDNFAWLKLYRWFSK